MLAEICERILKAELPIGQLHGAVASIARNGELEAVVCLELEDAVEHTPGFLISGKIDFDSFRRSDEYWRVTLCKLLLRSSICDTSIAMILRESREHADESFIQGVCFILDKLGD